jgi:hypothetical protein
MFMLATSDSKDYLWDCQLIKLFALNLLEPPTLKANEK